MRIISHKVATPNLRVVRVVQDSELGENNYVACLAEVGSEEIIMRVYLSFGEIEILHDAQIYAEYPEKENVEKT